MSSDAPSERRQPVNRLRPDKWARKNTARGKPGSLSRVVADDYLDMKELRSAFLLHEHHDTSFRAPRVAYPPERPPTERYITRAQAKRLSEAARSSLPLDAPTVQIGGELVQTFDELVEQITLMTDPDEDGHWGGRAAVGTVHAFLRRLDAARPHLGPLIRGQASEDDGSHAIDWRRTNVTVIDLNQLHDRAKRFVVGVVLKRMFEEKEATGSARPLTFVVLDELNRYAPREGRSPIKEVLLDIAERGRSL